METRDEQDEFKVKEVFRRSREISLIAHHARCQAHEAEIRANCAVTLAERAVVESDAVQDIAETLTKTARVVAQMSLEHINSLKGHGVQVFSEDRNSYPKAKTRSKFDVGQFPTDIRSYDHLCGGFHGHGYSRDMAGELRLDLGSDEEFEEYFDKISPLADSHFGARPGPTNFVLKSNGLIAGDDTESIHSPKSLDSPDSLTCVKYEESFPDTTDTLESRAELLRGLDSAETLPIVWEDSYQGPRENRPIPWSEKKSLRKIQRKLQDLDVNDRTDAGSSQNNDPVRLDDMSMTMSDGGTE
ncbi:hypothetical protein SNE40_002579 [Patella caerulea]|uniref:Uncharacterized protein n=1 Tax=Patella caerulea TaxID=87958 RepID=A0AAN8QED7_PATCE